MAYQQPFPLASAPPPPPKPFGPDLSVKLICPDCQEPIPNIVEEYSSGDTVCGSCGLVLGDRVVDTRSEWRTFANDEGDDPSRVGAAADPLMDGLEQLDTSVSFRDGGSGLARELQRTIAKSASGKMEKNLLTAFRQISDMCEQISLPKSIGDIAKQLYKRADQEKVLRGKSVDAVVACCIFIACRQARVPRTFKEICNLTKVPKKIIGQCYKTLEAAFNLNASTRDPPGGRNGGQAGDNEMSKGSSPKDLLRRYVNHLDLPVLVEKACADVVVACNEEGVAHGRSPVSIAGAAIYFVSHLYGQPKSAKEISTVAGVSDTTIKLVYRLMYQDRTKLVKKEWLDSGKAVMSRLPTAMEVPSK